VRIAIQYKVEPEVSEIYLLSGLQVQHSFSHKEPFCPMIYPDRIELILTYKHNPEDTEIFTEKVDAVRVGEYYKLVHMPAFTPNIAYGDIVKVEFGEGEFYFDELIEESGYSVAHVVTWKPKSKEHIITTLNELGCGVNTHVADNYLVVSIPPELQYQPVRTFLRNQKSSEIIDFRDCLSQVHAATV
jgi:hypothetical protein